MKKIAVFPGSFDPFTKGHEAVVHKALHVFDEVVIAIGINSTKKSVFSLEKRMTHIQSLFSNNESIRIDLCKEVGAKHIVRGLRDSKDFGYERSIAHMNNTLSGIETVFFLTNQEYAAINATIVREIYNNNGPISAFVSNSQFLEA